MQFSPDSHSHNVGIATATKSVNAAIIFNHIFFWLKENKARNVNQIDDHTWMYDSISQIQVHFPYFSEQQVKDALQILVDHGYLIKAHHSENKMDRRNWYALTEEDWLDPQKMFTKRSIDPMDGVPRPDGPVPQTRCIYKDTHNNTHKNNTYMSEQPFGRLTTFFFEKLKEINPKLKTPNMIQWTKEMKWLLEHDKRTEDEVVKLIEYILEQHKNPKSDFTWSQAVISPMKLRKHFSTIWLEMQKKKSKPDKVSPENALRNRKICEVFERRLREQFNFHGEIFFHTYPDSAMLRHGPKDLKKEYRYDAFEPEQLKQILLKDAEIVFPGVRDMFISSQSKITPLINEVIQSMKMPI
jgi:hypothetical protein